MSVLRLMNLFHDHLKCTYLQSRFFSFKIKSSLINAPVTTELKITAIKERFLTKGNGEKIT